MRLGLLGPADGKLAELGRAAEFLLNVAKVDRAIYLGDDEALEKAVITWAKRIVGNDPTDEGAWQQAAALAFEGEPNDIDRFIRAQRARLRLRTLESLPRGSARTIEMIGDRVAILIHDKALLDEEDIFAANLLVYGRSEGPLITRVGARWFLTPGPLREGEGGVGILDDGSEQIAATMYDLDGQAKLNETLSFTRSPKMRVQGDL